MTQAEFVGTPKHPGGSGKPGSDRPWSEYVVVMEFDAPDPRNQRWLPGNNSRYRLSAMVDDPHSFMIEDMSQGSPILVAYYKGSFLTVEESHRKRWLAEELILAAEEARGIEKDKVRDVNSSSVKSFRRAHELAVRRAHAAGLVVDPAILVEYDL
jgi:hypothetical protein